MFQDPIIFVPQVVDAHLQLLCANNPELQGAQETPETVHAAQKGSGSPRASLRGETSFTRPPKAKSTLSAAAPSVPAAQATPPSLTCTLFAHPLSRDEKWKERKARLLDAVEKLGSRSRLCRLYDGWEGRKAKPEILSLVSARAWFVLSSPVFRLDDRAGRLSKARSHSLRQPLAEPIGAETLANMASAWSNFSFLSPCWAIFLPAKQVLTTRWGCAGLSLPGGKVVFWLGRGRVEPGLGFNLRWARGLMASYGDPASWCWVGLYLLLLRPKVMLSLDVRRSLFKALFT